MRNIAFALVLGVLLAALVAYSLALPSFLLQKRQASQTVGWDARCFFEQDSQNNYVSLQQFLNDEAGAMAVASLNSNAAFAARLPKQDKQSPFESVDVRMLHANSSGIMPLDAYSGQVAVIAGNPQNGEGTIVDALFAHQHQLKVGDTFYLGMEVPEGSDDASSLDVRVRNQESGQTTVEHWDRCAWFPFQVDAIVVPDGNFSGVGCMRPQENIDALQQTADTYATELLIFGEVDAVDQALEQAKQDVIEDECYVDKGALVARQAKDEYLIDKAGTRPYCAFLLLLGVASLSCLAVDMVRKTRRRIESLTVFRTLGMDSKLIAGAAGLEELLVLTALMLAAYVGGLAWLGSAFSLWVPPAYEAIAAGILVLLSLGLAFLQAMLTKASISRKDPRVERKGA